MNRNNKIIGICMFVIVFVSLFNIASVYGVNQEIFSAIKLPINIIGAFFGVLTLMIILSEKNNVEKTSHNNQRVGTE